jgi:hypothetical protein
MIQSNREPARELSGPTYDWWSLFPFVRLEKATTNDSEINTILHQGSSTNSAGQIFFRSQPSHLGFDKHWLSSLAWCPTSAYQSIWSIKSHQGPETNTSNGENLEKLTFDWARKHPCCIIWPDTAVLIPKHGSRSKADHGPLDAYIWQHTQIW